MKSHPPFHSGSLKSSNANRPTTGSSARLRFVRVLLAGALLVPAQIGRSAVLSWSGQGSGANWSDSANWGYAGVPASGDTLIFSGGQPRLTNTNNISGLVIGSIRFAGASGNYMIYGNGLTLTNSLQATNSAGANTIMNAIVFATADVTIKVNASLTLAGALSGTEGVIKDGTGTLTYAGASGNTYSGTTWVNQGTLELGKASGWSIGYGSLIVGDGVGGAHADIVRYTGASASQLNTTVPVTINISGWLDLNGYSDDVGEITFNGGDLSSGAGTIQPENITVLGSSRTVNWSGKIQFWSAQTITVQHGTTAFPLTISASISDYSDCGFSVTNSTPTSDYIILSGSNSFTGPLHIGNVLVAIENDWGLGATNGATFVHSNSTLWVTSCDVTNESVTFEAGAQMVYQGASSWGGQITLQGDMTIRAFSGGPFDISGRITGTGNLTMSALGADAIRLSGSQANDFAGDTTMLYGVLELNKSPFDGAIPRNLYLGDASHSATNRYLTPNQISNNRTVTLSSGSLYDLNNCWEGIATLVLNGNAHVEMGTGYLVPYSPGLIYVPPSAASHASIKGKLSLNSADLSVCLSNTDWNALWIDARITGSQGLYKSGPGGLALTASNDYSGLTVVGESLLWVRNNSALGFTGSGTIVSNRASLVLVGSVAVTNEALTLGGTNAIDWGSLDSETTGGNDIWAGPVTLTAASSLSSWNPGNALRVIGPITGTGRLESIGHGDVYFEGSTMNTYNGTTKLVNGSLNLNKSPGYAVPGALEIDNGTVQLLNSSQLNDVTDVTIGSGGVLNMNGYNNFIDALSGSGSVQLGASPGSYLVIGNFNGSSTYGGVISGSGRLYKYGTGTIALAGSNTLIGTTYAYGGTLLVNGSQPSSPAYVYSSGTLGGFGTVGNLYCAGNLLPGASAGTLTCSNLAFSSTGNLYVDLNGRNPGTSYDQVVVRGTNQLAAAALHLVPNFTSPVALGDTFVIINNDGSEAVTGTFASLADGAIIDTGFYKFRINYGNDVILTLTSVPAVQTAAAITTGNGNHVIDPDECNQVTLVLSNSTASPMTGFTATLCTKALFATVTQPYSDYPDLPAGAARTNLAAFQVSTMPGFICGSDISLDLIVNTTSHGSFIVPVVLRSGSPASVPQRYDVNTSTNIPDVGTIVSTNTVAGFSGPLTKVAVSLWLTHPYDADLSLDLISPDGVVANLSTGLGAGANFGSGSADASRTMFDDAAATSIFSGTPPFVGSFRPEASLSGLIGGTINGNWRLRVTDSNGGTLGNLRCWSLFLYPVACSTGGGACGVCLPVVGSITGSDSVEAYRIYRDSLSASCSSPKPFPGTYGTSYHYDPYAFANTLGATACATIKLSASGGDAQAVAYLGSFDPSNIQNNYLGDSGSSPGALGNPATFSVSVPNGNQLIVVVNEIDAGVGCTNYVLEVSGMPCPAPLLSVERAATNNVRVFWPTWAANYQLEGAPALTSPAWTPSTNEPIVAGGAFNVTNSSPVSNLFFRLHQP